MLRYVHPLCTNESIINYHICEVIVIASRATKALSFGVKSPCSSRHMCVRVLVYVCVCVLSSQSVSRPFTPRPPAARISHVGTGSAVHTARENPVDLLAMHCLID